MDVAVRINDVWSRFVDLKLENVGKTSFWSPSEASHLVVSVGQQLKQILGLSVSKALEISAICCSDILLPAVVSDQIL